MPADRQAFLRHDAAARTPLTGKRRIDRNNLSTGARCLVAQDGQECTPARIRDALGEVVILDHVADLQIFVKNCAVLLNER
jgi:hypothetical protein